MAISTIASARGFTALGLTNSSVNNTNTETTIFTQAVPANAMGTNKVLRFQFWGTMTTLLLPPTLTIRIKFGSTTLTVVNAVSLLASQTGSPFLIEVAVVATGTGSQEAFARISDSTGTIILTGGLGLSLSAASWSVDTTSVQAFAVTVQFGTAVLTTTLTAKMVSLELG